jgi:hypothetical protein
MAFNKKRIRKHLAIESLKNMPPPFSGELMKCIVCDVVELSDPTIEKGWRCIELDKSDRYYVCASCLPAPNLHSNGWKGFYLSVFHHIFSKTPGIKPPKSVLVWRENLGIIVDRKLN